MRRLVGLSLKHWLLFGHFNEILHLKDINLRMTYEFRKAVKYYRLLNLGYIGHPFTWSNRSFGPHFIKEILYCSFCSSEWANLFEDGVASNMVNLESSHYPVMMEVKRRTNG